MNPELTDKLKKLREYYYEDNLSLKWIESVENNIRRLVMTEKLAESGAVQAIVADAQGRINTINKLLVFQEDLSLEDRNLLYRERGVHQFYLDRFEGRDLEKRLERIDNILDEELTRIGVKKGK